ncbi:helix-turn-helix domain-containing protein [Streptomyces sp. NPDC089919]|uniref:helix-turn-helix domain-containing protein n=1 Tax=Streptomyces sp. NPDC089919 TaxID=3155188 RepID=UPI003444E91A
MPEIDRPAATSSAVERGEVPEVAELGRALRALFTTLGVSQAAYGVRVGLEESSVSRYLNGRRLATEDFVDRLIREVGRQRGAPLTDGARAAVHDLRLAALGATDPAAHELERLRREMDRSRRTVERLARQQEALHDLLEKREAEADAARAELSQLRRDWSADTAAARRDLALTAEAAARSAREALRSEIARLRADLADTAALRSEAESRCAALEGRVRGLEEEIAALRRRASGAAELPIGELLQHLAGLDAASDTRGLGRALADVAATSPAEDVCEVVRWLGQSGWEHRAQTLIRDVARTRPVDVVGHLGDLLGAGSDRMGFEAMLCLAESRSVAELAALHRHWSGARWYASQDLLAFLVHVSGQLDEVLEMIDNLADGGDPVVPGLREAADGSPNELLPVLAELACQGRDGLAREPLYDLMDDTRSGSLRHLFDDHLGRLPATRQSAIMELMAQAPLRTLLDFLDALRASRHSRDRAEAFYGLVDRSDRGAEIRSYQGHRARVYPPRPGAEVTGGT